MSLPNHVFATTEPSETLQTTLESQKMALDWPSSASIIPELPSNRAQEQDFSISSSHYPQTATDLQQLHPEPCATDMELHTIDYATGNEEYLFPVPSQSEPDLLDPWIPNFRGESSIYPTEIINRGQYSTEQILPWINVLCEEICDFDNLIPIQFPQAHLVESQESTDQNLEHQTARSASFISTGSEESLETIKDDIQTKKSANIARGHLIEEVLRTLRQMDHQIRAMHQKDMADILCSNTV